ncbi:MAG: hypothetical protein ACO3A2_10405, partial [Bdellovibrionia bacterium]
MEKNELEFPKKIIYVNHYGENQGNLFKNLYLKLAGKFYSNLLSIYGLLPGCRFEGLLNRNLSGCPFLMTWMYEA